MGSGLKHVVCVGFGKSGTTLLNQELFTVRPFITPAGEKEINPFLGEDLTYYSYLERFPHWLTSSCAVPCAFEASPAYATGTTVDQFMDILGRIKYVLGDAHILFCVRHPAYRAYSHYIHNIQSFALYGNDRHETGAAQALELIGYPYGDTLIDAIVNCQTVGLRYSEKIVAAYDVFPAERVHFFGLERDAGMLLSYFRELGRSVGCEIDENAQLASSLKGERAWALEGSSLPSYYDAEDLSKAGFLLDHPGDLLIAHQREPFLLRGVGQEGRQRLKACAKRWTSKVASEEFEAIFDSYFREDTEGLCSFLRGRSQCTDVFEEYLQWDYAAKEVPVVSIQDSVDKAMERVLDIGQDVVNCELPSARAITLATKTWADGEDLARAGCHIESEIEDQYNR